ncbi:nuclear transport factor 2 family protein [Pseudomonas versuta]|uniref:Polyketide cyclase n=1 Tax=Pseudomonas versuta TaxID=1788301 RepID=A0A0M5LVS6_9PSED|nr:nuclear transport factor 2 family protein [Pseudomonas versuta]ALE88744.1 polyketide cyclase [Pseudomonas versuta]OKA21797.1 polyketide cyclase [Pseudomonas versuta]OKA29239.1 polyketide cyclase [Pseudomonas versuta]
MELEERVLQLEQRLQGLESENAIRACMNRYMVLCDELGVNSPLDELAGLFTPDALWEGKGAKYRNAFGGYRGRGAIKEMFATYMVEPAHFALNVHFLTSELIRVQGDCAQASWVMLQTSTFASGDSHLNSARLTVSFTEENGRWCIAHFQTENLFSRPVTAWNSAAALPVPARSGE